MAFGGLGKLAGKCCCGGVPGTCSVCTGGDPPACMKLEISGFTGCTRNGIYYGVDRNLTGGSADCSWEFLYDGGGVFKNLPVLQVGPGGPSFDVDGSVGFDCKNYNNRTLTKTSNGPCTDPGTGAGKLTAIPSTDPICQSLIAAGSAPFYVENACDPGHIPWEGVSVTLSGITNNSSCSACSNLNGTYVFNGPPQWLTNIAFNEALGWEVDGLDCTGTTVKMRVIFGYSSLNGFLVEFWTTPVHFLMARYRIAGNTLDCSGFASTNVPFQQHGTIHCNFSTGTCTATSL